jgi:hypothetical protein
MLIVYVAGPYRADTREGVERNIQKARKVAIALWERGYGVICPHLNTAHFHDDCKVDNEDLYLNAYVEILKRCDAVVMTNGWNKSAGAREEFETAIMNEVPVFHPSDLSAIEKYFSD